MSCKNEKDINTVQAPQLIPKQDSLLFCRCLPTIHRWEEGGTPEAVVLLIAAPASALRLFQHQGHAQCPNSSHHSQLHTPTLCPSVGKCHVGGRVPWGKGWTRGLTGAGVCSFPCQMAFCFSAGSLMKLSGRAMFILCESLPGLRLTTTQLDLWGVRKTPVHLSIMPPTSYRWYREVPHEVPQLEPNNSA